MAVSSIRHHYEHQSDVEFLWRASAGCGCQESKSSGNSCTPLVARQSAVADLSLRETALLAGAGSSPRRRPAHAGDGSEEPGPFSMVLRALLDTSPGEARRSP